MYVSPTTVALDFDLRRGPLFPTRVASCRLISVRSRDWLVAALLSCCSTELLDVGSVGPYSRDAAQRYGLVAGEQGSVDATQRHSGTRAERAARGHQSRGQETMGSTLIRHCTGAIEIRPPRRQWTAHSLEPRSVLCALSVRAVVYDTPIDGTESCGRSKFQKAYFFTLCMFIGEALCLVS